MSRPQEETPPRLQTGGDDLLGGSAAATVGRAASGEEDATERWGRLVGRGLALAASIALIGWALFEAAARSPGP